MDMGAHVQKVARLCQGTSSGLHLQTSGSTQVVLIALENQGNVEAGKGE